jgi:phosphatidylglycerophosphate synthase
MLTTRHKASLDRWLAPLARQLIRIGLTPTVLTLSAPVIGALLCLWVLRTRQVGGFCVAIVLAGCLDALDGAVARAGGRATKFGAYLDAVCDRLFEVIVAMTAAALSGYWFLVTGVLAGSLLVSYAKARAAMEVSVSNQEWPDLMERAERGLLFVAGLAAGWLVPWRPAGHDLFWWALVVLNVLVYLTVVQRVLRARRLIGERSAR